MASSVVIIRTGQLWFRRQQSQVSLGLYLFWLRSQQLGKAPSKMKFHSIGDDSPNQQLDKQVPASLREKCPSLCLANSNQHLYFTNLGALYTNGEN